MEKTCKKCEKKFIASRSDAEFCCRECYLEAYMEQNKDRVLSYKKQYYINNKAKANAKNKKYYDDNVKIRYQLTPCTHCDKEFMPKRLNDYYCSTDCYNKHAHTKFLQRKVRDFAFALRMQIHNCIRASMQQGGYTKKSRTHHLLGCSYADFLLHLGPKPSDTCHIDHICPCNQAKNETEIIKLQHYTNLQWLEASTNLTKSDSKTPEGELLCKQLLNRDWI